MKESAIAIIIVLVAAVNVTAASLTLGARVIGPPELSVRSTVVWEDQYTGDAPIQGSTWEQSELQSDLWRGNL